MTADDWRIAVLQVHGFREIMGLINLDELIKAGERDLAFGPLVNPGLFIEKSDALAFGLALLKAAQTFIGTIDATIATAKERAEHKVKT